MPSGLWDELPGIPVPFITQDLNEIGGVAFHTIEWPRWAEITMKSALCAAVLVARPRVAVAVRQTQSAKWRKRIVLRVSRKKTVACLEQPRQASEKAALAIAHQATRRGFW
jgi:hypothetical protein